VAPGSHMHGAVRYSSRLEPSTAWSVSHPTSWLYPLPEEDMRPMRPEPRPGH
jgi:hypothetical protein